MGMPDRKILVQKPKEERNLSAKAVAALPAFDSGKWTFQPKFDGCSLIIMVGINVVRIFSREGKECLSMPHIAEHFRVNSIPNMVYFGEAYHPHMLFKDISGMFRRHKPQYELEAWVFDAVTLQEFRSGEAKRPYCQRVKALNHIVNRTAGVMPVGCYDTVEEVQAFIDSCREAGYLLELDGMMAKQIDGHWIAGDDREGRVLKLKDHISVDLKVTGLIEGKGKFAGMVGAIEVEWRGEKEVVSGGKLTNEERVDFWHVYKRWLQDGNRPHPYLMVGKIVEVHALGITPDGKLREPRFKRLRDDKTEASE